MLFLRLSPLFLFYLAYLGQPKLPVLLTAVQAALKMIPPISIAEAGTIAALARTYTLPGLLGVVPAAALASWKLPLIAQVALLVPARYNNNNHHKKNGVSCPPKIIQVKFKVGTT